MLIQNYRLSGNRAQTFSGNHNSFIDIVTKGGGINKIIDTLSILCEKDIAFYDAVLDNIFANVILENKEETKKEL